MTEYLRDGDPFMSSEFDNTEAMVYVRSLRDPIKRRYAVLYLTWLRAGKKGNTPNRGPLPPALAKSVGQNLDGLQ